jgi:type II secretory pathway pseudopilin PulG
VVNLDGTKPSFLRIVGRSLCRDIPFEVLSFLFGEYPYGWHDRISKTMVVPVTYTPAEAASVDPYNKGKTSTVIVTLVILLFALPVLGLVSAVVLASIGHAKQEGTNSALQADMANVRLQAEIYFNQNNSFQGFCASTQAIAPLEHASQISVQTPSAYICNDSTDHWAASVPLLPAGYWCVDDSDNPPASTTASLGTQMSCDWLSLPSPAESVPGPTGF